MRVRLNLRVPYTYNCTCLFNSDSSSDGILGSLASSSRRLWQLINVCARLYVRMGPRSVR